MNRWLVSASAAAVAAASMAATTSVESSNVVGYSTGTSEQNFNFYTVPFNTIGYNTADIQQIKLSDGGAGGIGWGTELFDIWAGAPDVVENTSFIYYDPSMDPNGEATDYYWGNDVGEPVAFSIAPGQGYVATCDADLAVSVSGEVPLAQPISITSIQNFNFTGNPYPVAIDLQSISISDDGAGSIGWGTEMFDIWQGAPDVVENTSFIYYDPSMDPNGEATDYYWGNDVGEPTSFTINPCAGVVITCDADLTITIEPPYSTL